MPIAALVLLACMADGMAAPAQFFVARCSSTGPDWHGVWSMAGVVDHVQAFPALSAAMVLACLQTDSGRAVHGLGKAARRLPLMMLAMGPACLIAAILVHRWQPPVPGLVYALIMAALSTFIMEGLPWGVRRLTPFRPS